MAKANKRTLRAEKTNKRSMHVPRRTKMGGHTITIELDPELGDRAACFGQWHGSKDKIVIASKDVSRHNIEETYIHELIEAANGMAELRIKHNTIQILALMLHQALTNGEG